MSGAASGATLTFRAGATWSVNNSSTALGDTNALLGSFLDDGTAITVGDDTSTFAAEITVSGIPFETYDVYLYSNVNNGSGFKPIQVNGTYYTYADGATVSTANTSAQWGATAQTTPQLGRNVLVVSDVTGDTLTIRTLKRIMQGNGTSNIPRGSFAGFQIVCTGEIVKQTADVMSLNFATGKDDGTVTYKVSDQTGEFGLVPVPAAEWVDLETKANTEGDAIADTGATVTWSAKNTWNNADATDPLRKAYLDDGKTSENVGASVTVANVPYSMYDVIVYYSNDAGYAFKPVTVNGYSYTWDKTAGRTAPSQAPDAIDDPVQDTADEAYVFGTVDTSAPELGKNALRVTAQDAATLTVQGEDTYIEGENTPKTARGGIAALQVVERKVIDVTAANTDLTAMLGWYAEGTPLYIRVAAGGTVAGDVTLPADAILDLTASTFGEAPIVSGALTLSAGVEIRLPAKPSVCTIADTITGKPFVFVNGAYVSDAIISGGAITTGDPTYEWTGKGTDTNWSTAGNWLSGVVPGADSVVTVPLADGARKTITLTEGAVAGSLTITGPASGTATLAINGTGALTVSGQMATSGNVTVTQSADITVNGKSTMVYPSGAPQTYPERGAFHVEGAQTEYKVVDGTLSVPTTAEVFGSGYTDLDQTAGGFVVVCDNAKLTVGGGNAEAVLSVYSCRMPWPSGYPASGVALAGTVEVLSSGVFETDKNANFAGGPKLVTNGGTVRVKESSASVTYGSGYAPTSPLTLSAPEGAILTFSAGESGTLLTGSADVSIEGPGTVALVGAIDAQTYTGEISVQETGNLTLADNQRPKLSVASGASLTVTPSDTERENGSIVFPTSMTTEPGNVTYTVSGLAEGTTVKASVDANKLTLYWTTDYPTLSTSSNWSTTANWTNLPEETTPTYPDSGSVTLDGTQAAITVTLDTDLSKMTSIFVKGNVTLVTNGTESTTIPACVALTTGATLTIDANFSGEWTLPAGYTLQVTKGFTSFADLTLEGAVVILEGASGTTESPTKIGAPNVEFNGGLTIAASNLTLESMFNVGKTLALNGSNITLAGGGRFLTDNGTQVVNTGSYNAITGVTGLNGSLAVNSGTLALTLAGDQPTITSFLGATIAKDATLTLAGPSGWFPATGAGTLVLEGAYRPQFAVVTVGETSATDIPAKIILSATADEQDKGLVRFLTSSAVTIPDGFVAEVKPYEAPVWVPAYVRQGTWGIDICNVPAPSGLTGLDDAVALTLRQAAAKEGITNGNYTVQLRTKGGQTTIPSPDADALNDVLGCFTGLTDTADGTTLTYAYDFGIAGLRRTADGWVVTAKVQGAGGAVAGFAAGNAYTLKVTVPGETGSERNVNVQTVDETSAATGTVELTVLDSALQDLGDEPFTVGVSVSRNAPEL